MRIPVVFVFSLFAVEGCATPDSGVLLDLAVVADSAASRSRAWSIVNSPTTDGPFGVWGSGPDDVWAVGYSNGGSATIVHWNGSLWSMLPSPTMHLLEGVWGSGSNDVWAVGGAIVHWDGSAWSTVPSSPSELLIGVW